jgi:hypothetical protein
MDQPACVNVAIKLPSFVGICTVASVMMFSKGSTQTYSSAVKQLSVGYLCDRAEVHPLTSVSFRIGAVVNQLAIVARLRTIFPASSSVDSPSFQRGFGLVVTIDANLSRCDVAISWRRGCRVTPGGRGDRRADGSTLPAVSRGSEGLSPEPRSGTAVALETTGVPAPSVRKPTVRTADEGRSGPVLQQNPPSSSLAAKHCA